MPQSLVNRQLQDLVRQAKLDLALKGMPREKIEEQEETLTESCDPRQKDRLKFIWFYPR